MAIDAGGDAGTEGRMKSQLVAGVEMLAKIVGLPGPELELRFHPRRKWRLDLSWPDWKIAIECDGGTWSAGRHVRGKGFENDCEKRNQAILLGWRVFHFTSGMIKDGRALTTLERIRDSVRS